MHTCRGKPFGTRSTDVESQNQDSPSLHNVAHHLRDRYREGTFPRKPADGDGCTNSDLSIPNLEPHDVDVEETAIEPDQSRQEDLVDERPGSGTRAETEADDEKMAPRFTVASQLRATILNSWINVLILAAPAGIALDVTKANPIAIFVVNFVAIIPLAAMLSYATEEIALRTGETIGGLLNASFGNAVELIVAIIALVKNNVLIVQTSLIGSMLSNLLFVLGMCFFAGGIDCVEQNFNITVAQTASSMLAVAVGSLAILTTYHRKNTTTEDKIVALSRASSILFFVVYGFYPFFQLKSHLDIYNRPSLKAKKRHRKIGRGDASRGIAQVAGMSAVSMGGENAQQVQMPNPDDEPEQPQLTTLVALITLDVSTALVAVCAEFMVNSIDALSATGRIGETFVGLVLLPIVGNAAEHATAVTVACKDKMDLAVGVAVGSSIQIILLVLPLVVVIGWVLGIESMTLEFEEFQVIVLFVAALLVNYIIADGKSNWLEGVLLMVMYLIIDIATWYVAPLSRSDGRILHWLGLMFNA